ncbi:hypothetical protein Syncc9605_0195 [Synechococcus sp. CC9605]|nr:hypothetical protein Syncc9605_0195 [Synechococcus sp. CC9605]
MIMICVGVLVFGFRHLNSRNFLCVGSIDTLCQSALFNFIDRDNIFAFVCSSVLRGSRHRFLSNLFIAIFILAMMTLSHEVVSSSISQNRIRLN